MHLEEVNKNLKVIFIAFAWYTLSIIETVYNKTYFSRYPYVVTLSFFHAIVLLSVLFPMLKLFTKEDVFVERKVHKYIASLGLLKISTSVFSHYSLYLLSVSYVQTFRTLGPVLSIILSRLYYGESQTWKVYASISCIIAGVSLASATEQVLEYTGIISATIMINSTVFASFYSRHYFREFNINPIRMLFNIKTAAFLFIIPVWFFVDFWSIIHDKNFSDINVCLDFLYLLVIQGVISMMTHCLKFLLMALVSPVTYTVINSAKAMIKILMGFMFYSKIITAANFFGSIVAIYGVLMYTYAKQKKYLINENKKQS